MKAEYIKKENATAELKVVVDGQQWTDAQAKAKKKLAANAQIPGFRKGHVPASMLNKVINPNEVIFEAVNAVAQDAYSFGLDENKDVRVIDRPQLDVEEANAESVTLKFLLTVYPNVTLGDYKAAEYKVGKVSVTKKEVDEEINKLLTRNSEEVLKEEGTVNKGDIAVIDFEGFVDGVAFEGGKGTEYPLEIGSGSFIPGFEDQVIGMAINEEKDINVTFPKEYAAELAGKDATFKVKVDGIKEKRLPELTDEFVAELKVADGVDTVDALTKHFKKQLKESKTAAAEEEATNNLLTALCDCCTVDIPAVMVENEIEDTFNNYASRMAQQGISMDMYFQITGSTKEMFKENLREECEKKVRVRLVLDAIGTDMNVVATDEELEDEFKAMAEQYQMDVEEVKKAIPASYLADDVKMRKTLDTLKNTKAE